MRTRLTVLILVAVALLAVALPPAATAQPRASDSAHARPTVTVRSSAFGRILFDSRGFALYGFTKDSRGRSNCSGACAAAWPPYILRGSLRAPAGVKRSLLGTIRRADGRRQVTFAGKPLYFYVGDTRVGQVSCQNVFEFGGLWLVVRPGGKLVR